MSRYIKSSNPFEEEDDAPSSYSSNSSSSRTNGESPFEDRRQQIQRKVETSENNQLDSTQRALAAIYESEAMGVATAEELVRQGETLDNIETKTDGMQQNLTTSQKHLNNIKSVFGGIKNWWSRDSKPSSSNPSQDDASSRLKTQISTLNTPYNTHPERPKPKVDMTGFYDEEDDLDSKFMAGAKTPPGASRAAGQYSVITPVTRSAREAEVDSNLEMMCDGMSRLKGLAAGLGDEIERQTDQLGRINNKVEVTDGLLTNQNSQIRKILKK